MKGFTVLTGIFLFLVQPFRTGDEVTVQSSVPIGGGGNWMEGICEKIDLRCEYRMHIMWSCCVQYTFFRE